MKHKKKVLIIDDEPTSLTITRKIVTELGYEVHTAKNVERSVPTLFKVKPDCILLDIMMPDLSGEELVNILKKSGFSLPIVIYVSSLHPEKLQDIVKRTKVQDYLCKPITAERIKEKLAKYLTD